MPPNVKEFPMTLSEISVKDANVLSSVTNARNVRKWVIPDAKPTSTKLSIFPASESNVVCGADLNPAWHLVPIRTRCFKNRIGEVEVPQKPTSLLVAISLCGHEIPSGVGLKSYY